MGKGCDPGAGRATRRVGTARVCFWRGGRYGTPSPVGPGRWRRVSNKLTEIQYVIDVREMPGKVSWWARSPGRPGQLGWEDPGEWVGGCCVHSSSLVAIATATQLVGSAQHMSLPGPSAEALQPAHAHSDPGTPYTFYPYHQHPPRPQPASATPHAVAPPDDDQARRSSAGAAAETNHHQPLPPPPPTAIDGAATPMAGQYAYERDRL